MRSSELAERARVNPETLRYYERRGLLKPPPRTPGGYRDYPSTAVALLLHLDAGGPESCDAARALAEARRADLETRIADLQRMHASLTDLIATCERPTADRACALLEAIAMPTPSATTGSTP
jgi:MerR family mercuric resistance operon transcriptional regulator